MTSVPLARLVLEDVRTVRQRLEEDTGEREWRLDWVLAVVLLRTVGDVVHKVESAENPSVKAAAAELHRSWAEGEENAIFRDFIKAERNSIVHEYSTALAEGPAPIVALSEPLSEALADDLSALLDAHLLRPMEYGPFAGEDGRDLIDDAIAWWERQLDEIDRRVLG